MPHSSTKKPLYRKVNTRARGVRHRFGGDYRHVRNTKRAESDRGSMHGKKQRGLDYTPLFRFLLSKVGQPWDDVSSEAVARLDKPEPIFWLVALHEHERRDVVLVGESTHFSRRVHPFQRSLRGRRRRPPTGQPRPRTRGHDSDLYVLHPHAEWRPVQLNWRGAA